MICPACGCEQRKSDKCIQCQTLLDAEPRASVEKKPRLKGAADPPELDLKETLTEERTEPEIEELLSDLDLDPEPVATKAKPKPDRATAKRSAPPPEPEPVTIRTPTLAPEPEPTPTRSAAPLPGPEPVTAKPSPPLPEPRPTAAKISAPGPGPQEQVRTIEPGRRPADGEGAQNILITTTQRIEGKKIHTYFGLINATAVIDLEESALISDKKGSSRNADDRSRLKTGMMIALRDLRGEAALLGANAVIATTFSFQRIDSRSLLLSAIGTAVVIEGRT